MTILSAGISWVTGHDTTRAGTHPMSGGSDGGAWITDPVTGAYSRALLAPRLAEELARAERTGGNCALFVFDVDHFKTVNDAYGHLRGDDVLRQITQRVHAAGRGGDSLFRYGGDEFVMLLPDTQRDEAIRLALRLTEDIRSRPFEGQPPLHLSVSLGVAEYPTDATTAETLMECADQRNYLAKRRGRGGAVADDVDTDASSETSRMLERDTALATAQEYLTRLQTGERGSLRVLGQPGAGHSRFVAELGVLAKLRGFSVVTMTTPDLRLPDDASNVVVLRDLDPTTAVTTEEILPPSVAGLVYATTGDGIEPGATQLPVLATVELLPFSPATLRIWLRSTLRGEPSRTLVNWLASQSGGLPARAARELDRVRDRDGLVFTDDGGWTIAPSLLAGPRRRTRLPVPMTGLVGRDTEGGRVAQLLRGGRLVTLAGPGGIGKTRLALSVAAAMADSFEDGAVFVPLADATSVDMVVAAIAEELKVAEVPGQPLIDSVAEYVADTCMLLVLDNFEQVVVAAGVVGELLAAAPRISVLATSRERLRLYGEQVYQVPPLALPDSTALPRGAGAVDQALAESPALALFHQRALSANTEFVLRPADLPTLVAICRRLDGLPLAIELAGALTDTWDLATLLDQLTHHLDALGDGPRDLPARQQTLRGAIDWSFVLLNEADQGLFATLAVFGGGCTLDAVRAVTGSDAADDQALAGRLTALANRSLLTLEADPDGGTRYRMLETIRAYALTRLDAHPDGSLLHHRHAVHYATLAELSATGMTGPEQAEWISRVEREYPNLRVGFGWVIQHDDAGTAARFCQGLWRYWRDGRHLGEGRDWLSRVLGATGALTDALRAQLLYAAAVLAATADDNETAYRLAAESLSRAEDSGERHMAAQARNAMGMAATGRGDYLLANDHFGQSLAIWQELGQTPGTAISLGNLTKVALRLGDVEAASRYAGECLALERAAGNTRGIVLALECLGQILLLRGDSAGAREALAEGLALSRTLGDVLGEAMALHQMGVAARVEGQRTEALQLLTAALARRHEMGDREDLATSLDNVAHEVSEGDPALALRLLAAAEALRERHRLPSPPEAETSREVTLATLRDSVAPQDYASALAAGRSTPLDLLVDQVLDLAPAPV